MVHIKTYLFIHFYEQDLVLLTRVPRNTVVVENNAAVDGKVVPALVLLRVGSVSRLITNR